MTKGEWLKQEHIHVYKPAFDPEEEVDEEWLNDWKIIRSMQPTHIESETLQVPKWEPKEQE